MRKSSRLDRLCDPDLRAAFVGRRRAPIKKADEQDAPEQPRLNPEMERQRVALTGQHHEYMPVVEIERRHGYAPKRVTRMVHVKSCAKCRIDRMKAGERKAARTQPASISAAAFFGVPFRMP